MTSTFKYRSPAVPGDAGWTEDIESVRLGSVGGISQEAQLGSVATSSIVIDDPDADVGHLADAIVGLKQFDWIETACPAGLRRIWTGYTGDRSYRRGEGERPSLITGPARAIDATLADINAFLTFRKFTPAAIDATSSFNRPAETDLERIAALLAVDFLSTTLYDGLVSATGGVAMDAADYAKQSPIDVLNDCAQQSGRNFFVFYDEPGDYTPAPGDFALFYDFNDAPVYPAVCSFSNVWADVDGATVFGPTLDAELSRDPSRICSEVLLDYDGGTVRRTEDDIGLTTSLTYGWRTMTTSTTNVKTAAVANGRADRYLVENASEDETLRFTVQLPKAHVNDWLAGQYGTVTFVHLPGYEDGRLVRCVRRAVAHDRETPESYTVSYEMTPLTGEPAATWAYYTAGLPHYARPTLLEPTVPGALLLAFVVMSGDTGEPTIQLPEFATVGGGAQTWTKHAWVASEDRTQNIGPQDGVAFGIFSRTVAVGEVTTTPVEVSPGSVPSQQVAVFLWHLPEGVSLGAVQTLGQTFAGDVTRGTTYGANVLPGGTVSVGSAMPGFLVLGGFLTGAKAYGNGPVVTPVEGAVLENADHIRVPLQDDNNHTEPWVYLAKLPAGGVIRATVSNSPGPTYPTSYNKWPVAGASIQLLGLTDIGAP